jgi:hypothetical protein
VQCLVPRVLEDVGRPPRHTDYSGDGGPFLPGQRDEELAAGRAAVTPGSWAATPAAIGSFRINPLNW